MKSRHFQLTIAREFRGLNQGELAKKVEGLSQPNLSKFEKGFNTISDDLLENIAKELNFPISFFDQTIHNFSENVNFRKRQMTKKDKSKIEYSYRMIGYILDRMSESIIFPDFNLRYIDLEDGFTPTKVAQYIRKNLGLFESREPVKNISTLLEESGIIIIESDIEIDKFDGVSFITDKGFPVVIIDKLIDNDRKRFTIAHELGHLIMHSQKEFLINNHRDKEVEANEFASEFLMPKEGIYNDLQGLGLSSLAELKRYWLTSMASIIRRAYDLKIIDSNKYTYFNIEMSRRGYRKQEPINVFIDKPTIFKDAYKIHIEDLDYSPEELSDAFCLPIDIIENFCNIQDTSNLRIMVS